MKTISYNEYMKTTVLIIIPFLLVSLGVFFYSNSNIFSSPTKKTVIKCTLEEKICPDGSLVYRAGTECEFTACPLLPKPETSTLAIKQTGFISGLAITVNSLTGDSRCPMDVQCIQKGNVTLNITIADEQNHSITRTISSDSEALLFYGKSIIISSISPEPISSKKIEQRDYRITFRVEIMSNLPPATKEDLQAKVKLDNLKSDQEISSPFTLKGTAIGPWYFEGSFPIELRDGNNKPILIQPAQAKGEWMTENFVPFSTILTFSKPTTSTGTLILHKDNPSGEASRDESLTIPIRFK